MSNTNKTQKRMNLFDVVVILLVLCLIATLVYRIYVGIDKISGQANSEYIVEFECDSEYNSLLEYVREGDAVYLASNGDLLGYIYAPGDDHDAFYEIVDDIPTFAKDAAEEETDLDEGAPFVLPSYEYDIIKIGGKIRLNSDAFKVKNGGYYVVGNVNITKGSIINVYTETAEFTLTVKDISTVG